MFSYLFVMLIKQKTNSFDSCKWKPRWKISIMNLELFLVIIFICHYTSSLVTLQVTQHPHPLTFNCTHINFYQETYTTCMCTRGLWAIQVASDVNGGVEWELRRIKNCIHVSQWVSEMVQVSRDFGRSILKRLGSNLFVVANKGNWQVGTECLAGPALDFYCIYEVSEDGSVFRWDCLGNSTFISPQICARITDGESEEGDECFENSLRRRRSVVEDFDEDQVDVDVMKRLTGDVHITQSLIDYVKMAAEYMLDLRSGRRMTKALPVQSLVQLTADIMKVTCTVVKEEIIEIAMHTFFFQQHERNHIREPFISHTNYLRIRSALETCKNEARAYQFVPDSVSMDPCGTSNDGLPMSSEMLYRMGLNISLPKLPESVIADPMRMEPIVEITWKTFLNAHSYCYRYFSNYFNDHHAFTVASIGYFSNRIQNIWYVQNNQSTGGIPKGDNSSRSVYDTEKIWYGNILGDTSKIFRDVDRCYRASRITSDESPSYQYPWFMNRPPSDKSHDWWRRKRSLENIPGFCKD